MKRARDEEKQEVPIDHRKVWVGRQALRSAQFVKPPVQYVSWQVLRRLDVAKVDDCVGDAQCLGRDASRKLSVLAHDQIGLPGLTTPENVGESFGRGRTDEILFPGPSESLAGIGWRRPAGGRRRPHGECRQPELLDPWDNIGSAGQGDIMTGLSQGERERDVDVEMGGYRGGSQEHAHGA